MLIYDICLRVCIVRATGLSINHFSLVLDTRQFDVTDRDRPQVVVFPTQTSSFNKRFMFWALGSPARWLIVQHGSELPLLAPDKEQANKALRENPELHYYISSSCSYLLLFCLHSTQLSTQRESASYLHGSKACVGGKLTFAISLLFHYSSRSQQGPGIMSLSAGQLPTDIITFLCGLHWARILINCLSKASAGAAVQSLSHWFHLTQSGFTKVVAKGLAGNYWLVGVRGGGGDGCW